MARRPEMSRSVNAGDLLRPVDLEQHRRLGIPPELLAAVARRVTDKEAREHLGVKHTGDLAGVLYARLDPETGDPRGYRLRRDHPEVEDGKPRDKYLSSVDQPALFFPPGAGPLLTDITVTVAMVEAEKSSVALTAAAARTGRPLLRIGTGGVWSWRGRIGKTVDASGARVDEKGPLPDLDRLAWRERDVVILFDANAKTNPSAQAARRALATDLTNRGARVRVAAVPDVNDPDDFVGTHGDAALWALVDGARPMQPASAADVLRLAGLDDIHGVTLAELEGRLRRLKDGLQGADALRRRTVREMLVAALKAEKISGAAVLADAAIGGLDETDLGGPAAALIADDVPWPRACGGRRTPRHAG